MPGAITGLGARLRNGETLVVAEGYLFELERRGYLKAGPYVPETVLDNPELVEQLHREFVHAGSDIVEALTYYGHKERLRVVGRSGEVEELNRKALELANRVGTDTGTLVAGNLSNTTLFKHDDPSTHQAVQETFRSAMKWMMEEGVDLVIGETFTDLGEAKIALQVIKEFAPRSEGASSKVTCSDMDTVITFTPTLDTGRTRDGFTLAEACKAMETLGATVTGLNCSSGPDTMIQQMREIRKVCTGFLACLPVPYRTSADVPLMQLLTLPNGKCAFPEDLDCFTCSGTQIATFAQACQELNIQYVGLCCGNSSRLFRILAKSMGKTPPALRYAPDPTNHLLPAHTRPSDSISSHVHVGV